MEQKKQFQSESKRLLELMVNSIYTHKEIFLRELISNSSDAIDKLCYISLTDDKLGLTRDDFKITVAADNENRTITVSDNGIGMTAEELEENLGVIAHSGSLKFKQETQNAKDVDIIGQFGVGFYSAFMIASRVSVTSRAYGQERANKWISEGADGYTIESCDKETFGTDIVIELKPDADDESFSEFLEEHKLYSLIKKYSDYVRWPIVMDVTKSRQIESDETDADGKKKMSWEDYTETQTINSRIPIWQRAKAEVSDEDCAAFYKEKFFDFQDPAAVIRMSAEGTVSFSAMLFVPSKAPFDYYTREYKAGLQLYSSGILIMEHCADLLPEYFRFVRGVVDSQDLSLNISREMLQHDRQLKVIANSIEKKIRTELKKMLDNEPDKYADFYKSFGIQLKYGIVNTSADREPLAELLMFYSSKVEKPVSFEQYTKNMKEDQKHIYYAPGENITLLKKLPQAELLIEKGFEILYLTDEVDEFVIRSVRKYGDFEFRSVSDDDLEIQSEDEKKETERRETENKDILDFVKKSLDDEVAIVRLSSKLRRYPSCLAAQGEISLEMERYLKSVRGRGEDLDVMKAQRVLELNPEHASFAALKAAYDHDKDKAAKYSKLLYGQALLTSGVSLDDPAEFSELISELLF